MESRALTELPYTVFGYPTLKDFMFDVQDEAVAQIMMRVKEEDMNDISSTMGSSFEELLALSFAKAEAYSVARDMSIPPSQDQESKGAENTMKRLLGKDRFFELIENSFAEVVATLFQSVDQSELAAKAFSKRPEFQFALEIWTEIEDRSSSKPIVPGSQQPSFRAKFLLDELEFVSRRLNLKVVDIWTPTLFSFVARSLLESIHPALGSLHTCTVLRRLQILVCVAGPVALSDYPLEMLLHSLRPYITDFQCSEDAIKLFWYLIDRGQKYLFENPSFVAGLAVSTLASLRGFLSTTQDSTTQESHFRATLTQAESFRRWFSSFLDKYEPSKLDEKSVDSLRKIFRSSQNIEPVGSARRGTYEGELMTELLHDKRSASPLLSRSATDLVFSLLCTEFQIPSDFRDDILGDDDAAAANAIAVLESIESQALGRGYRLWAARALGRAYAASGVVNDSLLKEQRVTFVDSSGLSPHSSSKYAILHSLCDLLLSSGFRNAGLAERTLQVIVQKLAEYPALEECMTAIPPPFIKSLLWAPYQCPELSVRELDRFEREYTICWNGDITAVEWAKELTLALSINAAKDPVIGSLVPILSHRLPCTSSHTSFMTCCCPSLTATKWSVMSSQRYSATLSRISKTPRFTISD
jgi:ataxia telangiectasia mutated family protein